MLEFINAKINIGLQIVRRREDGYHDLQTVFYPIGRYAGLPDNPVRFCDILEITDNCSGKINVYFEGRRIECPLEKNLVYRAACMILPENTGCDIFLDKHLPDGAGLGGGSADAAFTLKLINEVILKNKFSNNELVEFALRLGADCPFFLYNRPMYAEGIGEKLTDVNIDLSGKWILVIKPDIYVSTKEAFTGVIPHPGEFDLRNLSSLPIEDWQYVVKNDFENSLFPKYPVLREIKDSIVSAGALYASMSGSGSSIYGVFNEYGPARECEMSFSGCPTIEGSYLLKL